MLFNMNNFNMQFSLTSKFMSEFGGSIFIMQRNFQDVYKFEVPPKNKVHPTFHI